MQAKAAAALVRCWRTFDALRRSFWAALVELLLALAVALPFVLGWLAGALMVAYWWTVAAVVAGYQRARGRRGDDHV